MYISNTILKKIFFYIILTALIFQNNKIQAQNIYNFPHETNKLQKSLYPGEKEERTASTFPLAIGVASFLYLLNPIVLFENDKIAGGLTKEISLGFGKFGEYRTTFEYSYLFRADLKSHLRAGLKYDFLLKKGIKPSNYLQGTPVVTVGVDYFTDLTHSGVSPEISYGYSIRNNKMLFYPSLKVRYTYVPKGSNIVDFSVGIILGIANPFIDLKIRSADNK